LDVQALVIWLIVAAIVGWLGAIIMPSSIIGIVGGLIGAYLLPLIGIEFEVGIDAAIINALIGAVSLLIVLKLLRSNRCQAFFRNRG
jgi:uncharacterized membrane protein YeaQ/YmgE (transglycosylase-associated protein family)